MRYECTTTTFDSKRVRSFRAGRVYDLDAETVQNYTDIGMIKRFQAIDPIPPTATAPRKPKKTDDLLE